MNITLIECLSGAVIVACLAGCTAPTPRLDANFGSAVEMAKAQQTLHPEASSNTEPLVGLDGVAVNGLVDRYNQSFKRPPATTNVFNIGVGSSAAGAAAGGAAAAGGSSR
jgi:hypothetical protein